MPSIIFAVPFTFCVMSPLADRSRLALPHFLSLSSTCLITALGFSLCLSAVAASPSANAFVEQRTALPLIKIVEQQPYSDGEETFGPTNFRPSSVAFLCAHQSVAPRSRQMAKMCADMTGIVLLSSSSAEDGPQRPILIGSEGIGIGTQRKRHFWSGQIAALEGRSVNSAGGESGEADGARAAKRGYDYIRFGRRSSAAAALPHLAKQQKKKSSSAEGGGARGAYDYIRFG